MEVKNSLLFKCSSKKKLSKLLSCSSKFLAKFKNTRNNYNIFSISKHNSIEKRPIEEPKEFLKKIQIKLKNLLSDVDTPTYLYSAKKGRSYIDNAKSHIENSENYCLTMDIHHFYQLGRKTFLSEMLQREFLIVNDIAWLISDIATIPHKNNKHSYFPTGSPLSQLLIYWTYKKTFDAIYKLSKNKDIIFTLYVDDMTFSSKNKISKSFEKTIKSYIKNIGLEINSSKTKKYGKTIPKKITGCIVKQNKLAIRNCKRKGIIEELKNKKLNLDNIKKIRAKINSQQQIEEKFMNVTKKRLRKNLLLIKK